jgi:chromosome segregation ATPase
MSTLMQSDIEGLTKTEKARGKDLARLRAALNDAQSLLSRHRSAIETEDSKLEALASRREEACRALATGSGKSGSLQEIDGKVSESSGRKTGLIALAADAERQIQDITRHIDNLEALQRQLEHHRAVEKQRADAERDAAEFDTNMLAIEAGYEKLLEQLAALLGRQYLEPAIRENAVTKMTATFERYDRAHHRMATIRNRIARAEHPENFIGRTATIEFEGGF